jgi:mutator protein MutT
MSNTPQQAIEVAAGLVFRSNRLLIAQRYSGSHLGGLWEFPGGKREPGETWEGCLARELLEELGIEVRVGQLVETIDHSYPEKLVHLRFFRCEWLRNEPRALGCGDFQWVERQELTQFSFPPADERLLQKLQTTEAWWLD